MKILQVHNEYREPGGEEKVVDAEARLLRENNQEVVSLRFRSNEISGAIGKLKAAWSLPYSQESKQIVLEAIKKEKPSVMHVHNFFPLATPSIFEAATEMGVRTVLTLHNYRILCANGLLLREGKPCELCVGTHPWHAVKYSCYQESRLGSLAIARMIDYHQKKHTWHTQVDKFIALTDFAKARYIKAGLPMEKFVVKPNFIFDPNISPETTKSSHPKLLYVGRLSSEKGIATLLKAKKDLPLMELHIVGDGPLKDLVRNSIAKDPSVFWHGYQSSGFIYKKMRECDAVIFPSECYENFPITILEAMAMSKPVIASRVGGLPEIIKEGETGLFFESGNDRDLILKIQYLMANHELRPLMENSAKKRFQENYSAKANYQELLGIYQSLQ